MYAASSVVLKTSIRSYSDFAVYSNNSTFAYLYLTII